MAEKQFEVEQMLNMRENLKRVFQEAVEIAFYFCNKRGRKFGFSQIFDIVRQIIPTAFVLNTSHWIFYTVSKTKHLCVCSNYGFFCEHTENDLHCLNLKVIKDVEGELIFDIVKNGFAIPSICDIDIQSSLVKHKQLLFRVNFHLRINFVKELGNNVKYLRQNFSQDIFITSMFESYEMIEYSSKITTIQFTPDPIFNPFYGVYLEELQKRQTYVKIQYRKTESMSLVVSKDEISKFTLQCSSVDLPMIAEYSVLKWDNLFYSNVNLVDLKLIQDYPKVPEIRFNQKTEKLEKEKAKGKAYNEGKKEEEKAKNYQKEDKNEEKKAINYQGEDKSEEGKENKNKEEKEDKNEENKKAVIENIADKIWWKL